jgi:DNA (cytosine-5)-methyltransferase 1
MLTVGSLFSGIGGFEIGLERTGYFKTIWQCENNDYSSEVLKKHWPDVPNFGDITKVNWDEIKRPDVLCGGFPCQDISLIGNKVGLEGKRSGLWYEMQKAISVLRPRYAIVENVPGIFGWAFSEVLSGLAKIGYDIEWDVIQARWFGAGHIRGRLFIIANLQGLPGFQKDKSPFTIGKKRQIWKNINNRDWGNISSIDWDVFKSYLLRDKDGIPHRLDRLGCLGNAVVPQVAQYVGECIKKFDQNNNVRL